MGPKTIAWVGFEGVTGLDLAGPMEAFSSSRIRLPRGKGDQPGYRLLVLGVRKGPFTTRSGLRIHPDALLQDAPPVDTLFVPGGQGLQDPDTLRRVVEGVKALAPKVRRLGSVCTGLYGLAPSGLLDGRRVTTHWACAADLAARFPKLTVDANAIFLRDGKYFTSAGATSSLDLSLALIEEDYGAAVALQVARQLVVYLRRPGGQEQYSEPLRFQTRAVDPLKDLVAWIGAHLHQDLSVEALARRAHLSPRQFTRRFKAATGQAPATFVEELRLSEAKERLAAPDASIEEVAASLGYGSADVFRRAFERRFRLTPSAFRGRFAARS
ncbi:MAG: helix-turn-helix domain-containing protein [Holophagaceae bacterium]